MESKHIHYSEFYKEQVFLAWYNAGRPYIRKKIEEAIPEDEYGRKPDMQSFRQWRDELNWGARGDELDARVIKEAEDVAVQSKILMLKEQAARARKMQQQAEEFLDEQGFDSSSSAVQALIRGGEWEMKTRGMSQTLMKILELDNDGLMSETQALVERLLQTGEVIDVAEITEDLEEDGES